MYCNNNALCITLVAANYIILHILDDNLLIRTIVFGIILKEYKKIASQKSFQTAASKQLLT